MARTLLAGVVVATALGTVCSAVAGPSPILRSATVVDRHVVLELAVSDLRPIELTVSKRRTLAPDGAFLARNVRLQETIQLPVTAASVVRWQSTQALRPGVWFVQVKAVETGGVTDCPKFLRNCLEHWSNIRRIVVRASG